MIGLPLKETFTRLIPMTDATGDACAQLYQEIFARDNQPGVVQLFPHVRETLQKLYDAGLTLTIATSRQRFSLMVFLRDMQIEHLFSHIVTVNDYQAKRDSEWLGNLYRWLGLNVGLIVQGIDGDARRRAYNADITYGTNNEYGFDYLRDNMVTYKDNMVQRGHAIAILE